MNVKSIISEVEFRPFDHQFLAEHVLDVATRDQVNRLPWRGQFTPDFVDALIKSNDPGTGIVLDPFAGSGTTLQAALRQGRRVVGNELNPAAVILSRTYEMANVSAVERMEHLAALHRDVLSLKAHNEESEELDLKPIGEFIRSRAGIPRMLLETVALLAAGNKKTVNINALKMASTAISSLILSLPADPRECKVYMGDARVLPLESKSVGLVVTSPPYINVFNYHQNYRPVTEALGWQVLPVARAEMGSNRKHRQNRFLTVIQYGQDIAQALQEIRRVCHPGARVVFVVGRESRVLDVAFNNALLVASVAELCGGLEFVRNQERKFMNRYGKLIYEDILTWTVSENAGHSANPTEAGRLVGVEMLERGLSQSSKHAKPFLRAAIRDAEKINPSQVPVFNQI